MSSDDQPKQKRWEMALTALQAVLLLLLGMLLQDVGQIGDEVVALRIAQAEMARDITKMADIERRIHDLEIKIGGR